MSRIGQRFDFYELKRLLGRGGFAEVYYAEHVLVKNLPAVAIKLLLAYRFNEAGRRSFYREATILAALQHPNIVKIQNFSIQDGIPYLVMQYVSDVTLRQHHPIGTIVPLATVVSYVKQLAAALQYAHDQEPAILHLDVKPQNILLGQNGQVLLSDFGIAIKLGDESYETQEALSLLPNGTYTYTAPECFDGKPDKASDQYSLGIVAYEWLCGEPPFQGPPLSVAAQHVNEPPPSLRKKNPDIPAAVEAVVMKALAKRPEDRYPSIGDFAQALERASSSQPEARPKITLSRRSVLIGLGIGVPLLAAGLAGALISEEQHTPRVTVPKPTIGTLITRYDRHADIVTAAALSPDEKRVASGDAHGYLDLWSIDGSIPPQRYTYHKIPVESIAWSPTGDLVAYASADGRLHVLDATTCTPVVEPYYQGRPDPAFAVAWSGEHLLLGLGTEVLVFDDVAHSKFGDQDSPYTGHTDLINGIACSPDGVRVASASDDHTVQLWIAQMATKPHFSYTGHRGEVRAVAWSPDGNFIASGDSDRVVHIWSTQQATIGNILLPYFGHQDAINAVVWSYDNQYVASGSDDQTVQIWQVTDGSTIYTYRGHKAPVNAVTWSRDGKFIVSGGDDKTVQVWRAR